MKLTGKIIMQLLSQKNQTEFVKMLFDPLKNQDDADIYQSFRLLDKDRSSVMNGKKADSHSTFIVWAERLKNHNTYERMLKRIETLRSNSEAQHAQIRALFEEDKTDVAMPRKLAQKIQDKLDQDNYTESLLLLFLWSIYREDISLLNFLYNDEKKEGTSKRSSGGILPLKTDNDEYIRHFQEPLFLEERGSSVSLATIYVAPHVSESKLSAAEEIMQWYRRDRFASCMILYGEAGIGKTSLISKIIADASEITEPNSLEYDFTPDEVAAVALRDRITIFKNLEEDFSSVTVLTALFGINNIDKDLLRGKLLILDGFDELMVLAPEYQEKANKFISGLVQENHGLKILITTRPGYSNFLDWVPGDLITGRRYRWIKKYVCWTEHELSKWCEQYGQEIEKIDDAFITQLSELEKEELKKRIAQKKKWCQVFPEQYRNLPLQTDNDKRREVFCIPIILYIACNSDVNIESEKTIGQIYDRAFRSVITREHGDTLTGNMNVKVADRKIQKVHWQYTKELAYQMLFIGKLELIDDDKSDDQRAIGFRHAQNRTLKLLQAEYPELDREDLSTSKFLAVFHFAKKGTRDGIAFVHKTVYEYFAALKLYEDYFSKFNTEYFEVNTPEKAAEEVTKSYLEAFRYTAIPKELFMYLEEMILPCFAADESNVVYNIQVQKKKNFNKDRFLAAFQTGIRNNLLARVPLKEAVEDYLKKDDDLISINVQICMAFQNFTRYLSCLGYRNIDMIRETDESGSFLPIAGVLRSLDCTEINVYCSDWNMQVTNLQGADLRGAQMRMTMLKGANLQEADLRKSQLAMADLREANLSLADLREADLQEAALAGVCLKRADLREAKLQEADLTGANLQEADLQEANLQEADLSGAQMESANLESAILEYAILRKAVMVSAKLPRARLQWAQMQGANLAGADLREADLSRAHLEDTYLIGACLEGAYLQWAHLERAKYGTVSGLCTTFPVGFNPKEHGMIEVDRNGEPVK